MAEQDIEATPQPPLIETQTQPAYEPVINNENLDVKNKQPVKLTVVATPQPPLIDAQQQPAYESKEADSSSEKENIKSVETTPQTPIVKQSVQPDNESEVTDPKTENPVDTEKEQGESSTEETEVKAFLLLAAPQARLTYKTLW